MISSLPQGNPACQPDAADSARRSTFGHLEAVFLAAQDRVGEKVSEYRREAVAVHQKGIVTLQGGHGYELDVTAQMRGRNDDEIGDDTAVEPTVDLEADDKTVEMAEEKTVEMTEDNTVEMPKRGKAG